jgi:hypothetical protein
MQRLGEVLEVEVGYAAGPAGSGVAYAALNGAEGREVVRLPFRIVAVACWWSVRLPTRHW